MSTRIEGAARAVMMAVLAVLATSVATAAEADDSAAARAYVQAAVSATALHRTVAAETVLSNGEFPSSYEEMGLELEQMTLEQADLAWKDRQWVLTFHTDAPAPLPGKVLVFAARMGGTNGVEWACGYHEFESPVSQSPGSQSVPTTVPPELLPDRCRRASDGK